MHELFKPPVIESDPEEYVPQNSRLFVKAFQRGEDNKLYDMYYPTVGYTIGDSVRKGSITMLSASPTLEDAISYNKYNPTKAKPVYCQVESDDFYELAGTNPEVRLGRYRILRDLMES